MAALKILITNLRLQGRTGTELVVRDLALELQRQGHHPIVYSPRLGPLAREITGRGIAVTRDLETITTPPDIIHGHHHPALVPALLHFPSIPAVYVCHDAEQDADEPFFFPRISKYVAVDN